MHDEPTLSPTLTPKPLHYFSISPTNTTSERSFLDTEGGHLGLDTKLGFKTPRNSGEYWKQWRILKIVKNIENTGEYWKHWRILKTGENFENWGEYWKQGRILKTVENIGNSGNIKYRKFARLATWTYLCCPPLYEFNKLQLVVSVTIKQPHGLTLFISLKVRAQIPSGDKKRGSFESVGETQTK